MSASDASDASDAFLFAEVDADSSGDAALPAYDREVLSDEPVALLRFEELAPPIVDSVAGAAAWSAVGSPRLGVAGKVGSAAEFNGTNRFELAAGFDFPGNLPYTIEAWVEAYVNDGRYRHLLGSDYRSDAGDREALTILLIDSAGADTVVIERFANGADNGTGAPLSKNAWHHVAYVYDGTQTILYLDGAPARSSADARSRPNAPTPFMVGGFAASNQEFVGRLDEVAVYSKALSADRISRHFKAAPP